MLDLLGGASSLPLAQMLVIGTKFAVHHLKAGVRKFKQFAIAAKASLGAVWDKIRPYLHGMWTTATADFPDAEEVTRAQASQIIAELDRPEPAEPPQPRLPQRKDAHPDPLVTPEGQLRRVPGAVGVDESQQVSDAYTPSLPVPGAERHPIELAESSTMRHVPLPRITVKLNLPPELISTGVLSHEQVESITLIANAHAQTLPNGTRRAYLVGNGTGSGKSRVLLGTILNHWRTSKGPQKAVWISDSHGLGPQLVNADFGPMGVPASMAHSMEAKFKGEPKIDLDRRIPFRDGILLTAYSHFGRPAQRGATGRNRTEQLIEWLGPDYDGIIVFDESHNIRNSDAGDDPDHPIGAARAREMLRIINTFPNARLVFASATAAAEIEHFDYLERLGLWGEGTAFDSKEEFKANMRTGGLSAMEKLSADMKALGVYQGLNLSYRGVQYDVSEVKLHETQTAMYDQISAAWAEVYAMMNQSTQQGRTPPFVRALLEGVFWSNQQRCMSDLITAFKFPTLIRQIQDDLDNQRSVVIQVANTGAAQEERVVGATLAAGLSLDTVRMNPTEQLTTYIQQYYPVKAYQPRLDPMTGQIGMLPVLDAEGNHLDDPDLVEERNRLIAKFRNMASPDSLFTKLEESFGFEQVAEVTGRPRRLEWETGLGGKRTRVYRGRNVKAREVDIEEYMEGDRRILVFSAAGGTGRSYHADVRVRNQQQRIHYILQPGWKAMETVQGFGRTHRSGERQPPVYVLITTDLPGEKRFTSTIASRLDSMGAITRGSRRAGGGGVYGEDDNLQDEYARNALNVVMNLLNSDTIEGVDGARTRDTMGVTLRQNIPIERFLNRLLILPIATQRRLMDTLSQTRQQLIHDAKEDGSYTTELQTVSFVELDIQDERLINTEPRSGAETKLVSMKVSSNIFNNPWPSETRNADWYVGYVINQRSNRLYAHGEPFTSLDKDQHEVTRVRLQGTRHSEYVDALQFEDRSIFRPVPMSEAKALWEQEIARLPKVYTETVHLVTGAILPVANRLMGLAHYQLMRYNLPDGRVLIGREVYDTSIPDFNAAFGLEISGAHEMNGAQVYGAVLDDNQVVTLSNRWKLVRRRVNQEQRIRILDWTDANARRLEQWGAIKEVAGFQTAYYVPLDLARGPELIERMLRNNPITSVAEHSQQSLGRAAEGPRGRSDRARLSKMAQEEGATGVRFITDPTARDGDFVVEAETLSTTGEITLNLAFMPVGDAAARSIIREEVGHQWLNSARGRWLVDDWMRVHLTPEHVRQLQEQGYTQRQGETDHQYRRRLADEWIAKQHREQTSWWRRMVDAVRQFLSRLGVVDLTADEAARAILRTLRHRRRFSGAERDALERSDTESPTNRTDNRTILQPVRAEELAQMMRGLDVDPESSTTEFLGVEQQILGRAGGEGTFAQAQDVTADMLRRMGIPFALENLDVVPTRPLTSDEADRLLTLVHDAKLISRDHNQPIGRLLNFVVAVARPTVAGQRSNLSLDIRNRLRNAAQSERSMYGVRLAELRSTGERIQRLAENWDIELVALQRDALLTPEMEAIILEAQNEGRESLDLQAILSDPELQEAIRALFAQHGMTYDPSTFAAWMRNAYGRHWADRDTLTGQLTQALQQGWQLPSASAEAMSRLLVDGIMPHFRDFMLRALERRGARGKPWSAVLAAVRDGRTSIPDVVSQLASLSGWPVPSPEDIEQFQAWADEYVRLNYLSAPEVAEAIAGIPATDLQAQYEARMRASIRKRRGTETRRNYLSNQMGGMWSKWTRKLSGIVNLQDAARSYLSANLLATVGFLTRQSMDIFSQTFNAFVSGPLASALLQVIDAVRAKRPAELAGTVMRELLNTQLANLERLKMAVRDASQGWLLRHVTRETAGGFEVDIGLFTRINQAARRAWDAGQHGKAGLLYFIGSVQGSYRLAAFLDEGSKAFMRTAASRRQLVRALRDRGMDSKAAESRANAIMTEVIGVRHLAVAEMQRRFAWSGVSVTDNQLQAAADDLWRLMLAERLMSEGVPGTALAALEEDLQLRSWNLAEIGGPGAAVAAGVNAMGKLPLVGWMAVFGNAMGIATNRALMHTPLGFWPGFFGEWSGQKRPSKWYRTDVQRAERYIEAATGTAVGTALGLLVWYGLARVFLRGPDDPEERQQWMAAGGRQYSIQFGSGENAVSVGFTVGPLAPFRLPIMAVGIMQDIMDAEARKAERIDEAGESVGEERDAFDVISARGAAMAGNLIVAAGSGRTSLGLAGQFVDSYTGDLKTSSVVREVGNLIPYVPALRQAGRMANSMTDERLRTYRTEPSEVVQLLMPQWVPIPGVAPSEAAKAPMMNIFWEPWTPSGWRRVADVLTGNFFGLAEKSPSDKAWAVLAKAKYYPNEPRIGRAVLWPDGKVAPMREKDYVPFRRAYGAKLRAHLETVDLNQSREDLVGLVKWMDANAELEALIEVGYGPKPRLRR